MTATRLLPTRLLPVKPFIYMTETGVGWVI